MACVILLDQNIFVAVKENWVQNPILHSKTKIFYSNNVDDEANFELKTMYYFHPEDTVCYSGYVNQKFGVYFL